MQKESPYLETSQQVIAKATGTVVRTSTQSHEKLCKHSESLQESRNQVGYYRSSAQGHEMIRKVVLTFRLHSDSLQE
jgi:hypothetical protein